MMYCDLPDCSYRVVSVCGATWEISVPKGKADEAFSSSFSFCEYASGNETRDGKLFLAESEEFSEPDENRGIEAGMAPLYEELCLAGTEELDEAARISFSAEREKVAERIAYLSAVRAEAFVRYNEAWKAWQAERENVKKYRTFLETDSAYKRATEALAAVDFEAKEKGFLFVSSDWQYLQKKLAENRVETVAASRHQVRLTEEEIIRRISGGDRTGGSCVSVGFAYIANKMGLDVLDFRGGRESGDVLPVCGDQGGRRARRYPHG